MSEKARVLIADDHSVAVEDITNFLSRESDFDAIGSAADGRQALSMLKSLKPVIIILDISMPDLGGIETTHEIKSVDQRVRILVYTILRSRIQKKTLKPDINRYPVL